MTDQERVAMTLELDSTAEPIRGILTSASGDAHEFVGWLGLADAIERLLPHDDPPTASRPWDG
jgi:hypothetical protein